MKILLLCDRKSENTQEPIRDVMQDILTQAGYEVECIVLNRETLHPCIGCFGCWLKTPGQCIITKDKANELAMKEIRANAVILLSEITYGGFSADVKAFLDRSIQNILPYFQYVKGEMHHEMRYERFSDWIAVGYGEVSDAEKETFIRLADRNALNNRPDNYLAITVKNSKELNDKSQSILNVWRAGA